MQAINYLTDWINWMTLLIIPAGAGTMITYQALRKSTATDDSTIQECNKKISNTIKGAIIGITIAGTITAVKKFYE